MTRRKLLIGCSAVIALAVIHMRARAAEPSDGRSPVPVSITIADFVAADSKAEDLARDTTALIRDDLRQKPSLNIVDSVTLPQKFINPDEPPKFAELRSVGLRFIVVGRAIRDPRGRAMLGCRLWDVSSEQQVKGQWVVADEWQRAGHGLAEIIYDALAARLETVEVGK